MNDLAPSFDMIYLKMFGLKSIFQTPISIYSVIIFIQLWMIIK